MTFVERLLACKAQGTLSTRDLSIWFEVPYPTMWTWLNGRAKPDDREGSWDEKALEATLQKLEAHIKDNSGFPIPYGGGDKKRPIFIKGIRDGQRARLPSVGASNGRVQVRNHRPS